MFTGGLRNLIMDFFSDRVYRHHFDRRFLFQAAMVLGLAGSFIVRNSITRFHECKALMVGGAVCLVIVYVLPLTGSFAALQPYRFLIPLLLCLLPLASIGMQGYWVWWRQLSRPSRIWALVPIVIMLPNLTAYFVDLTARKPIPSSAQYAGIVEAIELLPGKGRILVDDIPLGHLAPHYTGKAIIGGLSTQAFVAHGFSGIDDRGVLFGKPTHDWTIDALSRKLDVFAVQYLVLQRDELVFLAKRDPERFESIGSVDHWQLFRYQPYTGYSQARDGIASATFNKIEVERGSTHELVLKFHDSRFLQSITPGLEIHPYFIEDLPVPFIRVTFADGVTRGVIRQQ